MHGDSYGVWAVLGALDDKIELNRRTSETLDDIAVTLFQSWFVNFDPVRAKVEDRDPGLARLLAERFPDAFQEAGDIPEGWTVSTIDALADINARVLKQSDPLPVIDYVEISEAMRGEVAYVARYERGTEPSRARRRLSHGDTVLSTVRPDRGAYFLCLNPAESLIASTGFAVLTSRDGHWAFLHAAMTRPEVGEELGRLADGGAYPAIRPEAIGGLQVVVPRDARIVEAFEGAARHLYQKCANVRAESRTLAAIRDVLLPKLLSGELRIHDAERLLSEAGI